MAIAKILQLDHIKRITFIQTKIQKLANKHKIDHKVDLLKKKSTLANLNCNL